MSFEEEGIASCRISSSSDVQKNLTKGKCSDCLECQANGTEGRLGARRGMISRNSPRRIYGQPIVVDLTNDEAKVTWKENDTSFKAADDLQEPCAMIADSSSRLHRDNNSNNSLATALRDRGPCVIPVQPNRCLPIHPAPPAPTRATPIAKSRKDRSPVLKLVKASILDIVDVEPVKFTTLEVNRDLEEEKSSVFSEKNRKGFLKQTVLESTRDSSSLKTVNPVKRKLSDEKSKERGKDGTKDLKKRRKSSDVNTDEFCKNCTTDLDKEGRTSLKGTTELCNGKKCGASIVGSTTENNFGKEKIVPPLRLKKIVHEGKNGARGNTEVPCSRDKEANYKIVTGATPRPDSASTPTTYEYWARENFEKDRNFDIASASSTTHDLVRRSSFKSDDYKLKYRRNRLRQKLKELQSKALDLAQEIANGPNIVDSSPQRNTRLRQMMNCYEKQIENVSKLLNKLYNGNPVVNDVIDVDDGKVDYRLDDESVRNFSPISSPEPPKLSPRSPVNYQNKSPDSVRNSPPVLPKVCLNASSNLDILNEQDSETVQLPAESTWITCEDSTVGVSSMTDNFCEEMPNQEWESNNIDTEHRLTTPQIPSSTSIDPCSSENVENIENEEIFLNNLGKSVDKHTINMMQEKKETIKELSKTIEVLTSNHPIIGKTTAIKKHEVHDTDNSLQISSMKGPIISSVTGGAEVPPSVRCSDVEVSTPPITTTQISTSADMRNILQLESNYYNPAVLNKNVVDVNKLEGSKKAQKVSSNTAQSRKTNHSTASTLNQADRPVTNQHFSTQNNNDRRIMTEQFPTLGNWVAKMSKKQVSKQKSKLQSAGNSITISTEESIRTSEFDTHKVSANNANVSNRSNVLNLAPQWNTERWHRQQHHQQRQQQPLFQHVAATPQSLPSASTLNSGICTPLSASQFYPSNYSIDPYGGATFGYHSALCPVYSSYPYSRLHPGAPLTSYHIPMQNPLNPPLRPLPHVDKHLSSLQDPNRNFTSDILKYPTSLPASGFQPPNDFGYDRLRTTSTNHNGEANCLSPLLLASSSLSSGTQQSLPRAPLSGYPASNSQYGRNRMIPDVVAAAAAAAVVAAASIGRQRASLPPYSKPGTATMDSVMEVDPTRISSNTSNNRTRDHLLSNSGQSVDVGTKESQWNGTGYHSIPNLILDGLPFVRAEHEFPQTSTLSSNVQDPASASATSLPQMSKEDPRNVERECETPHLGKVNRSPDALNNLKCSNCGVAGSMFKCLGCEVAFYCNERCQARHWSVHVEKCPKKMPKLKKVA
ncbi:hypothetical protein KPH14_003486 [Odynerus spinipes]|uniref:MYND-type domain-containing protein n=1 Tax=Odynerus spinipes TaxID=1348599 RepID=A0AAD9VKQ8_9HYME|nr:hypothetical protein KPH14_003486 [Odynerus spinipes]